MYNLMGVDGPYQSPTPGLVGGHSRLKIYGRLDCRSALSWIERGHYKPFRVFFADVETAVACGYRPCGVCMPEEYKIWACGRELA